MSSSHAIISSDLIVRSREDHTPVEGISASEILFDRLRQIDPNRRFLVDALTNETLTYGEFFSKTQSLVHALVEIGVEHDDLIVFLAHNSFSYSVAYMAALFLGVGAWHVSPNNCAFDTAQRIERFTGRKVVFMYGTSHRHFVKQMHEEYEEFVCGRIKLEIEIDSLHVTDTASTDCESEYRVSRMIAKYADVPLDQVPYYPFDDVKTSVAIMVCTSGSTGAPKGAMHSQHSLGNFILTIAKCTPQTIDTRALLYFSLAHISGSMYFPLELYHGNVVYLASSITTEQIMQLVEREKIHHGVLSPVHILEMLNPTFERTYDVSSLKCAITGGTSLPEKLAQLWRLKYPESSLFNVYGMTEFLCPCLPLVADHANTFEHAGTPSPGTEIRVQSVETGKILPLNEKGEICLRGTFMMTGYYNNPAATLSSIDTDGFYHTGDIGFLDDQLRLHVVDRLKEMIKIFGFTVYPTEIEQLIQVKFPQITGVVVVPAQPSDYEYILRAYVSLKPGTELAGEDVVEAVANNFPSFKHLTGGVQFVDKMPRTLIGKIDRNYFKKLFQDGA